MVSATNVINNMRLNFDKEHLNVIWRYNVNEKNSGRLIKLLHAEIMRYKNSLFCVKTFVNVKSSAEQYCEHCVRCPWREVAIPMSAPKKYSN